MSLKFYLCLNPEGQSMGCSLCVWIPGEQPDANQQPQDLWAGEAGLRAASQISPANALLYADRGDWKIMALGRLVLHPRCCMFTGVQSSWGILVMADLWRMRTEEELAFLCCCSGSMARTELAWSRCSVHMRCMSGCWNARGQVLLGGWHPVSHWISTKQWNLASVKQVKKSVPGEKLSNVPKDTHLASNRVGIQTWMCADLKPLPCWVYRTLIFFIQKTVWV